MKRSFVLYKTEDILREDIRTFKSIMTPFQRRSLKMQFPPALQARDKTLLEHPGFPVVALQYFSYHYIRQGQKPRNGNVQLHPQQSAGI
ncbi:hypothetical protein D3C76_1551280 [compost metagenome]